ncbi:nitroreductase family protein [Eilatimonas milleporae]|uniref:Nitroreductase n=1 Tax=Eilatimonas milleporae TaxID=911205 RepID=A0A3M0CEK2_9PROT|nr:nitroreductase family protein [Eilatimonas milleporae]RMB01453.1 nitroreductase [Eilatimonas milleporae]
MTKAKFQPLTDLATPDAAEMEIRSRDFLELMKTRRTVRQFSDDSVPEAVIRNAVLTAGRAPSGANKQPWHFAVIGDPTKKQALRDAAEEEERAFYSGRASEEWLKDLEPFGTDANKPFLETAPWLIVVFRQMYGLDPETGAREQNYYVHESVGLACGFLIAALHQAGLATLTHTPSPMTFLNELCERPKNERAIMVVVTGRPASDAEVPVIDKKPLDEISSWFA